MDRTVAPDQERPHEPGPEQLWNESWYFDFAARDGSLGGYVRVGRYPNLGVVWYWACLVGEGRPLVTVIDHTVPLPRDHRSNELRNEGLWADHVCGTPLEHWNLGLEAFGVALDDPADAYGDLRGDRTPLGFDLEWETAGTPYLYPPGLDRYEVPCDVHGTIQVGSEELAFEGTGQRDHSWGVRDWWMLGWLWSAWERGDGQRLHAMTTMPAVFGTGYRQDGDGCHEATAITVEHPDGPHGIPPEVRIGVDGTDYVAEPLSWAPVLLEGPDGRLCRFPRGLCRFTGDDGDVGVGWLELGQPELG